MTRSTIHPTHDDRGHEKHPAWALIGASRQSTMGPRGGAVLFDSDIRHVNTVVVTISTAKRDRSLYRDRIFKRRQLIEVEMSEAQWASFVSSMNVGEGVPCTLRQAGPDHDIPGMPHEPRLRESMDEVRGAATRSVEAVALAFAAYEEKKNAGNLRSLKAAIQNMPGNIAFAAESLTEHAENVVQRARADVEAMVAQKATQLGLEPGELGVEVAQLEGPS